MGNIQLSENAIVVDGKEIYLRSGSIHYWRLKKEDWYEVLKKSKEANLNCITTYIPWFWHEYEEGMFDFTGETIAERDVMSFIEMVEEMGLYLVARPGPFINSELRFGGYPTWLFENHPEVISKRSDGTDAIWSGHGCPVPSQLNETYLGLVKKYYEKVIPLLSKHSIKNDGSIILFQPDNEMNLTFTYGVEGSLFDSHIIGDGKNKGLWHEWLLKEYDNLSSVNKRYGLNKDNIAEIPVPEMKYPETKEEKKLMVDWLKFKQWHVYKYGLDLAGVIKELGLDIPYELNEPINKEWFWGGGEHGESSMFFQENGQDCITGGHNYLYGGEMDIYGLTSAISRAENVKTSSLKGPAVSMEAGAGWCHYGPQRRANYNWDLLLKTLLGHGFNGINIYIFASGINPKDSTRYGKLYNWNSPIAEDVSTGEIYDINQNFFNFIAGWENKIIPARKKPDVMVGIFTEMSLLANPFRLYDIRAKEDPYNRVSNSENKRPDDSAYESDVYNSVIDLVTVLTDLNINFEYLHLNNPGDKEIKDKLLIIPNPGLLNSNGYELLEKHLQGGGKVMFYPELPTKDIDFEENSSLEKLVKARLVDTVAEPGFDFGTTDYHLLDGKKSKEVGIPGAVNLYEIDEESEYEVLATYKNTPCIFKQNVHNGEVIVMGVLPYLSTDLTREFFDEIFSSVSGKNSRSLDGILSVVSRENEQGEQLILAANNRGNKSSTKLEIEMNNDKFIFPMNSELDIKPKESRLLWANLDLGYVRMIYSTTELIPLDEDYKEFKSRAAVASTGEFAFDKKLRILIDGEEIAPIQNKGLWIYTYEHQKESYRLEIE